MKKVSELKSIPTDSIILDGFGQVDYHDIFLIYKPTDKSPEEVAERILRTPSWVNALLVAQHIGQTIWPKYKQV